MDLEEKVLRCFDNTWLADGCPTCVAYSVCEKLVWKKAQRDMPNIIKPEDSGSGSKKEKKGSSRDDDDKFTPRYV